MIAMSQNISNSTYIHKDECTTVKRSFFSNIEMVLTSRCNIGCRHCIYDCKPFSEERFSKPVIRDLIRQAALLDSVRSIIFTGGEAFLEFYSLKESIALCKELGLESSAVTNGFWALNHQTAKQKLEALKGLKTINVSTDSFHQEFVPVDRIRNIIESCHELGINCVVRISYLNDPVSEIEAVKKQLTGLDGLYTTLATPVAPFGRASTLINKGLIYTYDPEGIPCCGADDPVIDVNGDVKFCPGGLFSHPDNSLLKVGNIYNETLEEIRKSANLNPIVQTLRLRGPSGLVHLARTQAMKEKIPFILSQTEEPRDLCSLCKCVIANPNNANILQRAVGNPEVCQEIALGRLKEFDEISMLNESMYAMKAGGTSDIIADTI